MKENVAAWIYTSKFAHFWCYQSTVVYEERQLDKAHQKEVMKELLYSMSYGSSESIINAVVEDLAEGGHDMRKVVPAKGVAEGKPEVQAAAATTGGAGPPAPTTGESNSQLARTDTGPCRGRRCFRVGPYIAHVKPCKGFEVGWPVSKKPPVGDPAPPPPPPPPEPSPVAERRALTYVRAVPRFTAAVVVALRTRLGQMSATTPGAAIIVEREANRLMREYNVREVDAAAHLPRVLQAYFVADTHYRVPTSKSRMSRFQRWLMGSDPSPTLDRPLY